jgi:hypothetical protein
VMKPRTVAQGDQAGFGVGVGDLELVHG